MSARLAEGAIVDEIDVEGVGAVPVRFSRCEAGWQAAFELNDPSISDLAVVHRLVAPTLREARANSKTRIALESLVADQLRMLPPESRILINMSDHGGVLQRAGIPLRKTINEHLARVTYKDPLEGKAELAKPITTPYDLVWFIMGEDTLLDVPNWANPERIVEYARLAVVTRPGWKVDISDLAMIDAAIPGIVRCCDFMPIPMLDIRSRELRERLRTGMPYRYQLRGSVRAYIEEHGLYHDGT